MFFVGVCVGFMLGMGMLAFMDWWFFDE